MSRIRITCNGEAGRAASFTSAAVTYIDDEGRETDISDAVQGAHIIIEASADPIRAIVTLADVEVDAEIEVTPETLELLGGRP